MKCKKCGREIIRKKVKNKDYEIEVYKNTVLVTPETFGDVNTFLSDGGHYIKGRVNNDGIKCHIIHSC